jgi:hypothetical protein
MHSVTRKITLTFFAAGLLVAIGAPALAAPATQSYCNSDIDGCAVLGDTAISGGRASDSARTFTEQDNKKKGVEVILNYETHHVFGWTTDQSWQAGSSGDDVASESTSGGFSCSGALYDFYSRHYINGSQFTELSVSQFSCKA